MRFAKSLFWGIVFFAAWGSSPYGVQSGGWSFLTDCTPPRFFERTSVMSDAARVAAEALEMGFRSMAHLLNSIMELHRVKARIPCEALRPGDDIDKAAVRLKDFLQQLDRDKFDAIEVAKVAPWAFGRIHRTHLCCFELGNTLQSYSFWTNRLASEEWRAKWKPKHWKEFIVDPVVKYHQERRTWLAGFIPKTKYPAGDDGRLRDKRIYELACDGYSNDEIIEIIGRECVEHGWYSINSHAGVRDSISRYYSFENLPAPQDRRGRPKGDKTKSLKPKGHR